jgi:hypothetical protein
LLQEIMLQLPELADEDLQVNLSVHKCFITPFLQGKVDL